MPVAVDIFIAPRFDFASGVRFDFAPPVRLGATPVEVRVDGYRVYKGVATFGDVVLDYPDLDPPRSEFRPASEVMSDEALASMVGVPFTLHHPDDMLDEDTARDHMHGAVLSARRSDSSPDEMEVLVIVHSAEGQAAIESGELRELSPGYRAREDRTPGVHRGKRYDVVQRGHLFNHLAGVDMARARTPDGRVARLDEQATVPASTPAPAALPYPHASSTDRGRTTMPPIDTDQTDDNATRLDADAVTPPDDDEGAKVGDAMVLSDDDMALLKQMSPEGQAMLMGLMSGEAAEHEAMEIAAAQAAANAEGADIEEQTAEELPGEADDAAPPAAAMKNAGGILDAATVAKMIADAIAAAMGPKPDAAPPAPPAAPAVADKKDRAATDERLIAEAAAASTRAYNDAAALTEGVRKDGHDGIVGAESATAKALAIIDEHLPALRVDADAALKAGNVASFLRFYDAAEGKRRERLLDAQGAALVGAFRADDVGLTSAPAPFILPAAHVR
jgi:hypothetical protein